MTRKMSITISDYVFDTYLANISNNKSQYIETLIQKGAEVESGFLESLKGNNMKLVQDLRNKDDELKKLKAKLGRYEAKHGIDTFHEKMEGVKAGKLCAVCFEEILEGSENMLTPDGNVHSKCYLKVDAERRRKWKKGQSTLNETKKV